jgi:hypothetical protein
MWVHLAIKSGNRKVGPIPVSTTEEDSCPPECPLKDTDCYARFSFLGIHWRAVSNGKRGGNWPGFCNRVRKFVAGQRWRHNEAGDLPQRKDGRIAKRLLRQLSKAAAHTRGWTYTHYDPTDEHNAEAIAETNERGGMTINLSADNLHQADEYIELGIGPVVTILPEDADHHGNTTPGGWPIVVCPAQTQDAMTCNQCMICEFRDRKSIVGFLAHGTAKKRLSESVSLVQLTGDE